MAIGYSARVLEAYLMASGVNYYLYDTFTDTNGTALSSHSPDIGGPWTSVAGTWQIQSNAAKNADGTTGQKLSIVDIGSSDFEFTMQITTPSSGQFASRSIVRYASSSSYFAIELNSTQNWLALRYWSGSFATLISTTISLTNSTTYTLWARCNNDSIFAEVNGGYTIAWSTSQNNTSTNIGIGEYRDGSTFLNANTFDNAYSYPLTHSDATYTPEYDFAGFGDSITAGQGASETQYRYVNRIATSKGWALVNAGIGGTNLQNTVQNSVAVIGGAATNNGRDTLYSRILTYRPEYIVILYGINDLCLDDAAYSDTLFQNDLGEVVQMLLDFGISASKIVIGSPSYVKTGGYPLRVSPYTAGSQAKHDAYSAAASAIATAKGCTYVDVEAAMITDGGDSLISDVAVHPNDAGHLSIANAFLAVL